MPSGKQVLLHFLEQYSLALQNDEDLTEVSENLRVALLLHGSTPDHMWYTVERLEWASELDEDKKEVTRQGLAIKGKKIFLSDLLYHITEDENIPKTVKEAFPELTQEEYNSATHVMYLMLSAMDWSKYDSQVENDGKLDLEALEKFKKSYKKKLKYFRDDPKDFLGIINEDKG